MSKPPQMWYEIALKVIDVRFGHFNSSVHKETTKEVPILKAHWGDSGQGEAERTNSVISDALVDGTTLEWEK